MLAVFLDSFLAGCFWPRTWPGLIECSYFCLLFYWLYLCRSHLGKLQNFMQRMAGIAAMFSIFVIRFRLERIY